jgi:hypothetical protein
MEGIRAPMMYHTDNTPTLQNTNRVNRQSRQDAELVPINIIPNTLRAIIDTGTVMRRAHYRRNSLQIPQNLDSATPPK